MTLLRRQFLHFVTGVAALPAISRFAAAQTYPARSITLIVSVTPGGLIDTIGRVMAERMRASLGQPIIIENAGGADGSIGAGRLARARPDGYTIDLGYLGTHVLNAAFYSLQYDVLNDFAPISPLVTSPAILFARKTFLLKDLNELIAWLKANPGKASAGVPVGEVRLITALFQKETGTQLTLVPYRGSAPIIQDLMAGQIDLYFGGTVPLAQMRAGTIKAYAVASDTRLPIAPDIPTFAEMGLPALSYSTWLAFFAPRGTPKDIVAKLNAAAVEALADPAVQSRLTHLGVNVFPHQQQTPEALGALVKTDAAKWWPLIKEFGIKAE